MNIQSPYLMGQLPSSRIEDPEFCKSEWSPYHARTIHGDEDRAVVRNNPQKIMDLVSRESLNLIHSPKNPINPLPHPSHPLPIISSDELKARVTKIYQAYIINELFEFLRFNVIDK